MSRIIAFDTGTKRIGAAISDPTRTIAAGLGFLENDGALEMKIREMLEDNRPGIVVVGNPKNMNGTEGASSDGARKFLEKIKELYPDAETVLWDERLTSVQANRAMIKGNVKRKKRKQSVDSVAAVLILQNYLDFLKNRRNDE
ncbi:MAG TPA: Holliday junction resolvase RuvX [Firmicutes bacterium]|nr:Holliday junction resolvase RuvX [Bacillota bacterium]